MCVVCNFIICKEGIDAPSKLHHLENIDSQPAWGVQFSDFARFLRVFALLKR